MAFASRSANLYNPSSKIPFKLSRSKIDLFLECPRCFYLDRKLGVSRPRWPAFTLHSAVDQLLKNEFDLLRANGERHKLMKQYEIDAIPYSHPDLDKWRNNFTGIRFLHPKTNLLIFGAIDDVWINPQEELHIVEYKATSTKQEISLEDKYKQSFKKQVEIYQWLFRKNRFKVNDTGYFVYANAGRNRPKFDGRLEFEVSIIPHKGDDSWIGPTILEIHKRLNQDTIPQSGADCEYCQYQEAAQKLEAKP